jgi:hypothetical protein
VKRVAVVSFSNLERDPRVSRQLVALRDQYQLIACGFGNLQMERVEFIPIGHRPKSFPEKAVMGLRLLAQKHEAHYWQQPHVQEAYQKLSQSGAAVLLANDIDALPVTLKAAGDRPVLFDAHEYAPLEHEDSWLWRLLVQPYRTQFCSRYLHKSHAMFTVCQSIADEYCDVFGVHPTVVTNAPAFHDLLPSSVGETIELVCHTATMPARRLELMIEMMDHLDDTYRLTLILVPSGDDAYYNRIVQLANAHPRVRVRPPVPLDQIVTHLNQYDIGVYLIPPSSFNTRCALPNKLFEFIQARLAVAIGPSPEMRNVILNHTCGTSSEAFTPRSLATAVAAIDRKRLEKYKQASHDAARVLSAERNGEILREAVAKASSMSGLQTV